MATTMEIVNDLRAQVGLMNKRGFSEGAMKNSLLRAAKRLEELDRENSDLLNEVDFGSKND